MLQPSPVSLKAQKKQLEMFTVSIYQYYGGRIGRSMTFLDW